MFTSSPPCWWTVNKTSLIRSFCLSTSICSFHHCYLCLPRLHESHLLFQPRTPLLKSKPPPTFQTVSNYEGLCLFFPLKRTRGTEQSEKLINLDPHLRPHRQDFRITQYINYAYIHCLKKTKDRTILSLWDFSYCFRNF